MLLRPLAAALVASPRSLEAFYAATDLTPEMLGDADARVSPAQFCVAWAEAFSACERRSEPFDHDLRRDAARGYFGIVEYVCRSAPTLGAALSQWCRYLRILDDAVEVALVDAGPDRRALRVVIESEAPAPASHELGFVLVASRAKTLVEGDPGIVEVGFAHSIPAAHRARLEQAFGVPVRAGAAETELVFRASALERALVTADPNLLAILVTTADAQASKPSPEALVADQVRRALGTALKHADTDVDAIARRLGMTARSLQRRLKDDGVSFQTLRDETRQKLAEGYLKEGLTFAEISFLLGFSEPSAFFRAFKRWTGRTPVAERERLRIAPVAAS